MAANDQYMKGDIMPFAAEMKKMINNKDLSDIKFMIGPNRKTIFGHRVILSARCEVFRAMFADQAAKGGPGTDQEVPFVLSDISPEIFLSVMEFLYTNCVNLTSKTAIDVLASSLEYGLDELRKLCVSYLVESLSINNACDTMQAAVTYGQDELREKTLEYIELNTQNIFKTKSFHEMSEDALSVTLQSDNLLMDETDILASVREWATVNSVVLGRPLSEICQNVVKYVRLPLFTPEELTEVEQECKKDRMIPVESLSFAWKCHALKKGEQGNPLTRPRKGTKQREFHKVLQSL